jgi:malate permease and related proteins
MLIIITQILILGILAGIGVIGAKAGIIDQKAEEVISRLVFSITLPLMIFTSLVDLDITASLLKNGALVLLFAYFSMFLLLLVGLVSTRLLKLDHRKGTIHTLHTMFGNHVFLGFPLINALYPGGEGLFYATLFYMVSSSLTWTIGVYLLNRGQQQSVFKNLIHLLNPNSIAFVIGIAFMLAGIKLPQILDIPLRGVGNTTNFLSMLYIGAMLAQINIRGVLGRLSVIVLCFNKQLLIPFVLILLTSFLTSSLKLEFDPLARSVVILQSAMPSMAVIVVLARKFGADDLLAAENLFVTTILSLVTLPVVYFLIEYF